MSAKLKTKDIINTTTHRHHWEIVSSYPSKSKRNPFIYWVKIRRCSRCGKIAQTRTLQG